MAPLTAYMFFCNAKRDTVRQKLVAEGHDKLPVTVVAKELGQLWKALSDEEKAAYKAQAEEQHQQQQAGNGDAQQDFDAGEQQQQQGRAADGKATTLPVAWVRRVVGQDPEVARCSAEAVQALSAAADVFLAVVCAKATASAVGAKRCTVRLDDIDRSVRGDKRLVTAGLTAVVNMVTAAMSVAADSKVAPPGKKPRLDKPAAVQNNSIERAFGLA